MFDERGERLFPKKEAALPPMPPKSDPTVNIRELYHSPNGDRWYLVRDSDAGRVFVKHQANMPSGGHIAEIEIGAFLNQGNGPEHQELLRLIGTLLKDVRPPTETANISEARKKSASRITK